MIKLKIVEKNGYTYKLKDEKEKEYNMILEFLDIDKIPQEGDYIFIAEMLLNPSYNGYSTRYTFGNLNSIYGKNKIFLDNIDIIMIMIEDKEIYLKRLYG